MFIFPIYVLLLLIVNSVPSGNISIETRNPEQRDDGKKTHECNGNPVMYQVYWSVT